MDHLSVIKWTIMEKAEFGLHSLNAERKMLSYSSTAWYCVLPPQEDSSVVIRRPLRMYQRILTASGGLVDQLDIFS